MRSRLPFGNMPGVCFTHIHIFGSSADPAAQEPLKPLCGAAFGAAARGYEALTFVITNRLLGIAGSLEKATRRS